MIDTRYQEMFTTYIGRGVSQVWEHLQSTGDQLPSLDLRLQALQVLQFALKVDATWPITREVLFTLAPKMEQAGHRDDWRPFLEEGIRVCQAWGDVEAEGVLRLQLGKQYRLRCRYLEAREQYRRSARIWVRLGDRHRLAQVVSQLAYLARLQDKHAVAWRLAQRALALAGDFQPARAHSLFVLGTLAADGRNYAQAEIYFREAQALWEEQGELRHIARSLRNLGTVLYFQQRCDEAIVCFQRALSLFEHVSDPVHRALTQMNLGIAHLACGQQIQALELFQQAEGVFRNTGEKANLALLYGNFGYAYRHLGRLDEAAWAYEQAIKIRSELGNVTSLVNAMDGLGLTYQAQGKTTQAAAIFREALERLEAIRGHPRYEYLRRMISGHLREVRGSV